MQQRCATSAKNVCRKILQPGAAIQATVPPLCDIFINHRGTDTMNMKPGDKLFGKINPAIRSCKLGVAIFSPNYCDSYFCLHELALMMESKKRVIPVFCDVKPSQLQVVDYRTRSTEQLQRFSWALEEAKYTVGLAFDTLQGDWPGFLNTATDAVIKNLVELEAENSSKKNTYIVEGHQRK
ncbi:Alpha-galactosidase 2 [Hibiscus syriacus]|uniref:Alpha-galactosidase 2 n=1 Tax=Hibiscus syriacus TaxID=106335 RepID=A0A6A3BSD9_HIBSY|nr:Alpha-galactosidase 2 [Hibiscus syriacus]